MISYFYFHSPTFKNKRRGGHEKTKSHVTEENVYSTLNEQTTMKQHLPDNSNTYEGRINKTDMQQPKNSETFYSDMNEIMPQYKGDNDSETSQKEIPVIVDMKRAVKGGKKKNVNK